MLKLFERMLTKTEYIVVDPGKATIRRKKVTRIAADIPPLQKLLCGICFMILFIVALTAIQIAHLVVPRSFNNEISYLMSTVISVTVGAFFGAKV